MTVVANYVVMRKEDPDWGYSWRVSAGVKLPTGDDSMLDQEDPAAAPSVFNNPNSLVGGHDLALGSGSYDGIIGTGLNLVSLGTGVCDGRRGLCDSRHRPGRLSLCE